MKRAGSNEDLKCPYRRIRGGNETSQKETSGGSVIRCTAQSERLVRCPRFCVDVAGSVPTWAGFG